MSGDVVLRVICRKKQGFEARGRDCGPRILDVGVEALGSKGSSPFIPNHDHCICTAILDAVEDVAVEIAENGGSWEGNQPGFGCGVRHETK